MMDQPAPVPPRLARCRRSITPRGAMPWRSSRPPERDVERGAFAGTNSDFRRERAITVLAHFNLVGSRRELHDQALVAASPAFAVDQDFGITGLDANRDAAT